MCQCGLAEFQNILCGGKKNKTRSVWLSCRQKVLLFVDIFSCPFYNLSVSLMVVMSVFTLAYNGFGLGEGGDFTTNVDAENQILINHKCVCGALNRHFCQARVMPSAFSPVVALSVHIYLNLICKFSLK